MAKRVVRETLGVIMVAWSPAIFFLLLEFARPLRGPWSLVVAVIGLAAWLSAGMYLADAPRRLPPK